jgi:hypothetical protein
MLAVGQSDHSIVEENRGGTVVLSRHREAFVTLVPCCQNAEKPD